MEQIVLSQFGQVTNLDAAHVVDSDGKVVAYVAEPESRRDCAHGAKFNDAMFRAAVIEHVASWEASYSGEQLYVQFDPGRDNCESVTVTLV